MAQTVLLKRSSVAGNVPGNSDLALGEIAVNTADGAVYIKKGNNDIVAVADNDILHIDTTNGRVGIGTTSPSNSLHVNSGTDDWPIRAQSTDAKTGIIIQDTNTTNYLISESYTLSIGNQASLHASNLNIKSTGNVGIGTTSPSQKLHVNGTILVNNEIQFVNDQMRIYRSTNDMRIRTGSTDRVTITSTGNVGIGTTSPSSNKLTVDGDIRIRDSIASLYLQDTDGTNQVSEIKQSAGITTISSRNNTSNGKILFTGYNGTASTEYARLDTGGTLLIGKTSADIGTIGHQFLSDAAGDYAAHTSNGNRALLLNRLNSDGEILDFRKDGTSVGSIGSHTSTTTNMYIGSVDSGLYFDSTNNRISPYYVNNNSLPNGGISLGGNSNRFQDLYLAGSVTTGDGTAASPAIKVGDNDTGLFQPTDNVLAFSAWGTERMRIDSQGKVGIGTTSPANLLSVESTGQFAGINIKSASSNGISYIDFGDADDNNIGGINYDNSTDTLQFRNGNAHHVFLKTDGKVGIGTGTPTHNLHVKSTGNAELDVERASGAKINLQAQSAAGYVGTDSNHIFGLKANSTVRLKIATNGAISFNDAYTFPTADGSANQVLQTDGSGNLTFGTAAGGGVSISNNVNNRVLTGDGINANAEANLTFDGSLLTVTNNGGHTSGNITISQSSLDIYNPLEADTDEKGSILTFSDNYNDGSYNRTIRAAIKGGTDTTGNTADGFLAFYTDASGANSATERMRITKDGNIGIGTSNPSTKLFVQDGIIGVSNSTHTTYYEHDKIHSYATSGLTIDGREGITLETTSADKDIIFRSDDGSGGVAEYFRLDGGNGYLITSKHNQHLDNVKSMYGGSNDLQIYHDGSNSYIKDGGTGNLEIHATNLVFKNADGSLQYASFISGGQAELRYNGSPKLSTTTDGIQVTSSNADNLAGPVITFNRDSASPADSDYLGQLKFKGENDADQDTVFAKITAKAADVSDGTEDGAIEFSLKKAGSNNINARFSADNLDLINGTGLTVAGNTTISGNLTVNGTTVTNSATNTTIEDALIELGSGTTGANSNDLGLILERGTSGNNAFIGFDESDDQVVFALTTATGSSTGNVAFSSFLPIKAAGITGTSLDINGNADISGVLTMSNATAGSMLNMNNNSIIGVNAIQMADPGPNEGVSWSNIKIYESPDNLTTNSAGNFQVVYGSTRRFTVNNVGADVNGQLLVNGANNNGGRADFAVDAGGSHSQLSLYGAQVQAGGTDMNYNAKFFHDANGGQIAVWDNNLTFTTQGSNTGSATARDIIFKPQISGTAVATERMRIKGDGNVGIGTASPDRKLTVSGTLGIGIDDYIVHNGDSNSFFGFNGADSWKVRTGGGDRFVIGNDNSYFNTKVGIGTASPSNKLHVHHANAALGFDQAIRVSTNVNDYTAGRGGGILMQNADVNTAGVFGVRGGGWEGNLAFYTHTGTSGNTFGTTFTEKMRITDSGRVGIGTTSPSSKLDIDTSGQQALEARTSGGYLAGYFATDFDYVCKFESTDGTACLVLEDNNSTNNANRICVNTNDMYFDTAGSERMRILANGNVGIGTTSPDTKLDITTSGVEGLILNQDTTTAATSSRLFFKDNVRANGMLNVNGILEFRTDMVVGNTSGAKRLSVSPTLVKSEVPLRVEEYQIDTTSTASSATTQIAIHLFAAATFRSARFTVQVTNSTDSTYHTTELLLVHNGTTANITEFGEIHTGSAVEATFDADINSGNVRLLATPASTDTMAFKVVCHSITT